TPRSTFWRRPRRSHPFRGKFLRQCCLDAAVSGRGYDDAFGMDGAKGNIPGRDFYFPPSFWRKMTLGDPCPPRLRSHQSCHLRTCCDVFYAFTDAAASVSHRFLLQEVPEF